MRPEKKMASKMAASPDHRMVKGKVKISQITGLAYSAHGGLSSHPGRRR